MSNETMSFIFILKKIKQRYGQIMLAAYSRQIEETLIRFGFNNQCFMTFIIVSDGDRIVKELENVSTICLYQFYRIKFWK